MTPELPAHIHRRITRFGELGDAFAEKGDYLQAIASYHYAQRLLPEPRAQWQAATWLAAAIADAQFFNGNFRAARDTLTHALEAHFPEAENNAFIYLRLGQSALQLGDEALALTALARAQQLAGEEIFAGEEARYRQFLGDKLSSEV